ncbi:MAG: hypothetical protein MUO87_06980, partial [Thermoplasmata archaeon]|nr:hypothetical protein [Thermoplasmata archaeon]
YQDGFVNSLLSHPRNPDSMSAPHSGHFIVIPSSPNHSQRLKGFFRPYGIFCQWRLKTRTVLPYPRFLAMLQYILERKYEFILDVEVPTKRSAAGSMREWFTNY